jgi:hypothetical protein
MKEITAKAISAVKAERTRAMRVCPVRMFELAGYPGMRLAIPWSVGYREPPAGADRRFSKCDFMRVLDRVFRVMREPSSPRITATGMSYSLPGVLAPLEPLPASWLVDLNAGPIEEETVEEEVSLW